MENRAVLSGRRLVVILLTTLLVTCLVTARAARVGRANDPDGTLHICIMDADGSHQGVLVDQGFTWCCLHAYTWSPDGSQIAYEHLRQGNVEISTVILDEGVPQNVTNNVANDTEPAWQLLNQALSGHHEATGDKGQIAFVSDRDGNNEIYVMAADGTNVVRLTNDPAEDVSPAWSPDGAKIAFVSDRDGNNEIYVMAADGSNQINLTTSQAGEAWPEWSPDGSKIVYYSWDGSTVSIYTMDADGSNRNELYSGYMSFLPTPSWSPNGTQLAMECLGEGSNPPDICVMDADGTNVSHLTNTADGQHPTWSPDGSMIAFERARDIYVIAADGSNLTNLTTSQAEEFWPEWSPRGDKIAYEQMVRWVVYLPLVIR